MLQVNKTSDRSTLERDDAASSQINQPFSHLANLVRRNFELADVQS